ncbi:MAG: hypothetical protein AB1483_02480 [Candidatus Zixiibacteriota bacterium]
MSDDYYKKDNANSPPGNGPDENNGENMMQQPEAPDRGKTPSEAAPGGDDRTYYVNRTPPQALVIHCSDPRFQQAFRSFITEELGIRNYAPIIIGGGVHALGMRGLRPKNFKVLWEQIRFFMKVFRPTEIVVINHEDCLWYEKMKGYHPTIDRLLKGKLDMLTAEKIVLEEFPLIEVRAFWAALDSDRITFKELTDDRLS